MQIGVLGTGLVGETIATALVAAGHRVRMGSRSADNPQAAGWSAAHGPDASHGTFADAVRGADIVFNCTAGAASLEALRMAGADTLADRILVDVANPLDFSRGMPPTLTVCNTDSLGEQIQREFPRLRVVKTLNTVNALVMVDPARVPGKHHLFLCGNDPGAKARVAALLESAFRWPAQALLDLGDITAARATEMLVPIWVRLFVQFGTGDFSFHLAGAPEQPAPGAGAPPLEVAPPAVH